MQIDLYFVDSISNAYIEKLQAFDDDLVARGLTENLIPCIYYPGMNEATSKEIFKLRMTYDFDHAKLTSELRRL